MWYVILEHEDKNVRAERCGEYLMRIFICVWQKKNFMCFSFLLIKCRNMSQTSENERAEQIWSGWSKFGVGGANLVWVEQI